MAETKNKLRTAAALPPTGAFSVSCPSCRWATIHHRARTNDYRCAHCGHVFKEPRKQYMAPEEGD